MDGAIKKAVKMIEIRVGSSTDNRLIGWVRKTGTNKIFALGEENT